MPTTLPSSASTPTCKISPFVSTDAQGDEAEASKYQLFGIRLDTSGSVRDVSVPPLGDPTLDLGVTPRLAFNVRSALDHAWKAWELPERWRERARAISAVA